MAVTMEWGKNIDEWLKETDRMEEESKRERRQAEINGRDTEERESQETKPGLLWAVHYF